MFVTACALLLNVLGNFSFVVSCDSFRPFISRRVVPFNQHRGLAHERMGQNPASVDIGAFHKEEAESAAGSRQLQASTGFDLSILPHEPSGKGMGVSDEPSPLSRNDAVD